MTERFFGHAELLEQSTPTISHSEYSDQGADAEDYHLDGWTSRLLGVDETLMLRVWRRLLADESVVADLLNDDVLRELHDAIRDRLKIPTDTNPSLVARSLLECSDTNPLLPWSGTPLQDAELVRRRGTVTWFRGVPKGWTLRLKSVQGESLLVRFGKGVFLQNSPRGLYGARVLVLGLVDNANRHEIAGIAVLLQVPATAEAQVGATSATR